MSEHPLRITVIAPECPGLEPLAWLSEIGAIAEMEGVALRMIAGPEVTRERVARGLREPADVLIWSGHGSEKGLILSDGSLVNARWLATQVRCAAPRIALLAACGSAMAGARLESLAAAVSRTGVNAVGFPLDAADRSAVTYNVELIRALAAGADVGTAHEVALESVAGEDPGFAAGIVLTPGLTNGYRTLIARLDALEAGQRRLEAQVAQIASRLGA